MTKAYIIDVRKFDDTNFLSEALSNASLFRREKYESYKYEKVKKQSIAVAYLLDQYLHTIGLNEKDMEYEIGKYGKPSIKGHSEIKFCLSHSDNLAMAVFSDQEVGCDVEKVQKIDKKLMDMVLSENEKKDIMDIEGEKEKNEAFFRYWVMKEAILKHSGFGIINGLKTTHDNSVYIGDFELPDISEKYYFAIYEGGKKLPKVSIDVL